MENDEAAKERIKNLTVEVMDHVYDEKEADGILARDSRTIIPSPQNKRSESMEN